MSIFLNNYLVCCVSFLIKHVQVRRLNLNLAMLKVEHLTRPSKKMSMLISLLTMIRS